MKAEPFENCYALRAENQSLSDRIAVLEKHLDDLQQAEGEYRLMHDQHGGGSMASGRAWDRMRRTGDIARATLNREPTHG